MAWAATLHKEAARIWALRKDQSKQRYYKLEVLIGARVRRGSSEKYAEEKHHVNKSCWIEISQEEEAAGASK